MIAESKKMIGVTQDKLTEVIKELKGLVVRSFQKVWIGIHNKTHRIMHMRIQMISTDRKNSTKRKLYCLKQTFDADPTYPTPIIHDVLEGIIELKKIVSHSFRIICPSELQRSRLKLMVVPPPKT